MKQGNTLLARGLLWFAAFVTVGLLFVLCCAANNPAALVWSLLLMAVTDLPVGIYAMSQGLVFELMWEHTWKAVCGGVGFSGATVGWGVGFGTLRRKEKMIYPKLRQMHGTREAEQTDEEVAREEIGGVDAVRFARWFYHKIARVPGLESEVLTALDTGGFAALVKLLVVYWLDDQAGYWQLEHESNSTGGVL